MKLNWFWIALLICFTCSDSAWSIPVENPQENQELLPEKVDSNTIPANKSENKSTTLGPHPQKNVHSEEISLSQSIIQETSLQGLKETIVPSKDNQNFGGDETDFYLFDQEALDAQKPSLELYQTLSPLLTPEMKKDAKKLWVETADLRENLDFSTSESGSKELILPASNKEMTLIKGEAIELSNKNLPPALSGKNKTDKVLVRELFDGIYDLIKNALLIIAGVLILGKLFSIIAKKIIRNSERKKKRKARRRRRKRRRTFA